MSADILTANGMATPLPAPGPNSIQPNGYNYVATGYAAIPGQDEVAVLYRGTTPQGPDDVVVAAYNLQGGTVFEQSYTGTPQSAGSQYAYAGAVNGVITVLDNGDIVVGDTTYAQPNDVVEFRILTPGGAVVASGSDTAPGGYNAVYNLQVATLPGKFVFEWDAESKTSPMTRVERFVSDTGAYGLLETNQTVTRPPAQSFAQGANGAYANVDDDYFAYGSAHTSGLAKLPNEPDNTVTSNAVAILTSGQAVAAWVDSGTAYVATFDPAADAFGPSVTIDWGGASDVHAVALPDGGYVVSWMNGGAYKGEVFAADGTAGGVISPAGDVAGIDSHGNLYTVGANGGQYQVQTYAISGSGSGSGSGTGGSTGGPSGTGPSGNAEAFAVAKIVTLSGSPQWTAAAVLSSHALAVVGTADGGYGSHVAVEQTYDASGSQTSSNTLMGYAGPGQTLTPGIIALTGGFSKVTYSGAYEIDNAYGQQVFVQNQWTRPDSEFRPLTSGGYITDNSDDNSVFGLFDAHAQSVGWFSLPSWTSNWAYQVTGLSNGGFVIWGGNHDSFYGADGTRLSDSVLAGFGDNGYGSAAATQSGFDRVWLSQDGSHGTLGTELTFQAFDATGAALTGPISFGQDLDPWHTWYQIEANTDGAASILWSQGGAVFGAEYANGQIGQAYTAFAGDLPSSLPVQLNDDQVGFAYIQNSHLLAELFNPSTGAVSRIDLGTASGDISTVHALATTNGSMALSWRTASGTEGAILQANGQLGGEMALPGDLLGVNSAGEAVTVHDVNGMPVMQTYVLNDAYFWVH